MAAPSYSTFILVTFLMATYNFQTHAGTCKCSEGNTSFRDCKRGQADWRSHTSPDVELFGDCLPEVPAK